MANNVKSEIKNTGFADIPCDETIHRDDNHIFHLCKWNIKDQFIGYSDVIFTHKDTHRLLHPDYTNSLNPYNVTLSSATLSRITNITNKYLADKRIYISVSLEKPNYYYSIASLAAKAVDCKSTTKKHRRFESFLSHLVCFMTHHKFYNVTLQYGGLTPIVYREVYKDRFTPYRYRDIVNSSKTDILVTQKVTFRN